MAEQSLKVFCFYLLRPLNKYEIALRNCNETGKVLHRSGFRMLENAILTFEMEKPLKAVILNVNVLTFKVKYFVFISKVFIRFNKFQATINFLISFCLKILII